MNADLLEKYRYCNVDFDDWIDCIRDFFTEDMAAMGIAVDKVGYVGFGGQSDDAWFHGHVSDWPKFLTALGYDDPILHIHATACFGFAHSDTGRRYNGCNFSSELPLPEHDEDEDFADYHISYYDLDDVRSVAMLVALSKYDETQLSGVFVDAFKDQMRNLYRMLLDEYDYLTSDEAVWEAIVANEWDKQLEEA
jgi:hypothetical protein